MELTLNIKAYFIKKLLEVNLRNIRINTSPIWQKTGVHFSRYLTPNVACRVFSKSS